MTTETKVEAVAYLTHDDPITTIRRIVTAEDFDTAEDMHLIARVNGWDPLYPQSALDALRGEVERLRDERDNLRALADEAIYVGCMIGLDCAATLADLQERRQYVPRPPSRADARKDAKKISEVYCRGVNLLRGMSALTKESP